SPGDATIVIPTPLATLGCSICYDLRFPELYRALARDGAELLLVPSAFTFPTGAAHWDVLCRARAVENQCFLLAATQVGPSPNVPTAPIARSGCGFARLGDMIMPAAWSTRDTAATTNTHSTHALGWRVAR